MNKYRKKKHSFLNKNVSPLSSAKPKTEQKYTDLNVVLVYVEWKRRSEKKRRNEH